MKYVTFEVRLQPDHSIFVPVIFPELLVHAEMAKGVIAALNAHYPAATITVASGGFLPSIGFIEETHGESETLAVHSHPADTRLIQMADYGACLMERDG